MKKKTLVIATAIALIVAFATIGTTRKTIPGYHTNM